VRRPPRTTSRGERSNVKIDDLMTRDVLTVTPETPYKELVDRLVECGYSGLPVVDRAGALVGIVTEADLISKEAYGGRRSRALALLADVLAARPSHWATKSIGMAAADVMTTDLVVCGPDESVQVVARRMLARGVKRIPVVHAGHLVGIVSRHDLLKSFTREDAAIAGEVNKVLSTDLNRLDDCHVRSSVENGIVTLTGDVRYGWDVPIVAAMVRDVPGVIDVINEVHNREPNPEPAPPWMHGAR
jgi:CBS domain-containing protein